MEENESVLDDVEGGDEEFCFGYEEAATGELIIVEKRGLSEVRICDERACSDVFYVNLMLIGPLAGRRIKNYVQLHEICWVGRVMNHDQP